MAENTQHEEQEKELRSKLLKRLGIAGVMVLILLGVLAFFDFLSSRRGEENTPKVFTKPVPVPPKKEVTQAVKPALSAISGELPAISPVQTAPAISPVQVETPPVKETTEPVKEPAAAVKPAVSGPEKTPTAVVKPLAVPVKNVQPVSAKPTSEPKSVPEATAAPTTAPVKPEKIETPAPTVKPVQAVAAVPAASLPRLLAGFVVQAGVFTNARKAEELHAMLAMNGIPSTLEARVQVGPFKTREEAEAARKKLKELGIEGMMIPPVGRK